MITITEKAAAKVRETAKKAEEEEGLIWHGLRLCVKGGGCAGFSYDLYFEDKVDDMDETYESHGIKLFVDPLSHQYLEDTEIDYVEESPFQQGFKFNNPNVKGSCGCGSSVSF